MTPLRCWRVLFADRADVALAPVANPEGRFHHDGQPALYLSTTMAGVGASLARYVGENDPPRIIVGLDLAGGRMADLTDAAAAEALGIDPQITRHRWDIDRAAGRPPPTWGLADRLRSGGFDGLLYSSRQRSDLSHIALFRWNQPRAPTLAVAVPPAPWRPD